MARRGVLKSLRHLFQSVFNRRYVGIDQMQPCALAEKPDSLTPLAHHGRAFGLQGFNLLINGGEERALRLRLPYWMWLRHSASCSVF